MIIPENLLLDVADGSLPLDDVLEMYGGDALDAETMLALNAQRSVNTVLRSHSMQRMDADLFDHVKRHVTATHFPPIQVSAVPVSVVKSIGLMALSTVIGAALSYMIIPASNIPVHNNVLPNVQHILSNTTTSPESSERTAVTEPVQKLPNARPRSDDRYTSALPVDADSTTDNDSRTEKPDYGQRLVKANSTHRIEQKIRELTHRIEQGAGGDLELYQLHRELFRAYKSIGRQQLAVGSLTDALAVARRIGNEEYVNKCQRELNDLRK